MALLHRNSFSWLALVLGGAASLAATGAARANSYQVTQSSWGNSGVVNSFAWALDQANANPGLDVIDITAGLAINVDAATPQTDSWLTTISDSLPSKAMVPRWLVTPLLSVAVVQFTINSMLINTKVRRRIF